MHADDQFVVIDKVTWELAITRNMSFWHQYMSSEGNFHHLHYFGIHTRLRQLFLTTNGTRTHIFHNPENLNKYNLALIESINSVEKVRLLKKRYEAIALQLLTSLDKCIKDVTVEQWDTFVQNYQIFCAGLYVTSAIGRRGTEILMKKLNELGYADNQIHHLIATVTYPAEHTSLFLSQYDLMRIAEKIQAKKIDDRVLDKELEKWLLAYSHIPVNFCEEPWNLDDARDQLARLLKKDCKKERDLAIKNHTTKVKESKTLLKKINNPRVSVLAYALQEGTFLNEYRKNKISKASYEVRKIFKIIAQKANFSSWSNCYYLTSYEMRQIISGEKINVRDIIKKRRIVGTVMENDGTQKFLNLSDTTKLDRFISPLHQSVDSKVK
ncbi:hypothetical protein HYW21_07350 [Candidatus Woesearchaeota archaeon]|nr:hypothetical protein [Candidatus Woesearchaeota archaeon]